MKGAWQASLAYHGERRDADKPPKMVKNPKMPSRTSPKVAKKSVNGGYANGYHNGGGGSNGNSRSHSGQSTLPSSPSNG